MKDTKVRTVSIVCVITLLIIALIGCQAPAAQPAAPAAKTTAAAVTTQAAPAPVTTQAASQTTGAAQPASQTTAAAAPQTLKIGIQFPLTGPYPFIPNRNWVELSVNDVNVTGFKVGDKTYKIEPIYVDDKFTPEGQLDAGNRLVLAEKVKFIVGATSSASTVIQPVADPAKVLIVGISPHEQALGPAHPLTFASGMAPQMMIAPQVFNAVSKANPNLKRLAAVLPDDPSATQHIRFATEAASRLGLTYAGQELYPSSTKDFSPVVLRLLQKNPEIVYWAAAAASPVFFAGLISALRDQGYKGIVTGTNAFAAIVSPVGAKAEGIYGMTFGDVESQLVTPRMKELAKKYIDKYGQQTFNVDLIPHYDMISVLVQALQKAGTVDDTEKIAQVMRTGVWDGVAGKAGFTGAKTYGAPTVYSLPVPVSKWVGGKFNLLSMAQGEIP